MLSRNLASFNRTLPARHRQDDERVALAFSFSALGITTYTAFYRAIWFIIRRIRFLENRYIDLPVTIYQPYGAGNWLS